MKHTLWDNNERIAAKVQRGQILEGDEFRGQSGELIRYESWSVFIIDPVPLLHLAQDQGLKLGELANFGGEFRQVFARQV